MKILLVLLIIAISFAQEGFSNTSYQSTDTLNAASILKKSAERYAELKTYLDSGKVIRHFYKNNSPHKSAIYFKTAFSETGDFNFEYYEPGKSNSLYTVNRTEKRVQSWWGITNKIITNRTLAMSLAAASGVSSRTSTIVPQLLSPEDFTGKKGVFNSFTPSQSSSESVKGIDCYKIMGKGLVNETMTFWIGKRDFLIRKIETDKSINSKSTRAKADSILEIKFKLDSSSLQKRSDRETNFQKKAALLHELDSLAQLRTRNKALMNVMSALPRAETYSVKTTYEYYPYTLKVLDKKLFSFRPNREIAL